MDQSGSIKNRIREFVHQYAQDRGVERVTDNTALIQAGVVDSLGVFKLVAFIEETFAVRVVDEEIVLENFESIDRIEQFVSGKLDRK